MINIINTFKDMEYIEKYKHDGYKNANTKLQPENYWWNAEITIIDYVKLLKYEVYHIDITFVNDLLLLIYEDECCIHHDMLYKYGVLSEHDTHDVKRLFEQYKFIENEQYIINREMPSIKR